MTRLPPFVNALIFSASLFASASTYAQSLAGTWDLVESPDGRGPTAGTMTLSPGGAVNFAGNRSTWQPNSTSVQFTVMGAMQVPASEVSMQLVGSTLQGKLVAYKYRMSGGQAVEESKQTFSLSARRQKDLWRQTQATARARQHIPRNAALSRAHAPPTNKSLGLRL